MEVLQTKSINANGSKGNHKFTLSVTENSISESTNSSELSWEFKLSAVNNGFDWKDHDSGKLKYSLNIGGNTYSGIITDYDGKSTVTLKSGNITMDHDADGTKTISLSFSVTDGYNQYFTPGNASASDTMTLTAIDVGCVYIANASGVFEKYVPYIHNGTTFERYAPHIHDGSNWQRY